MSLSELDRASYNRNNFLPLKETGVLQLFDGETTLFPGIEILTSDGHTPGQQHILIRDNERPLFFCADLFPTFSHIRITWISAFDLYPLKVIEEKKKNPAESLLRELADYFSP